MAGTCRVRINRRRKLRTRLLLVRVTPMHHDIDAIEPAFEELLIGRRT